MKFFLINFGNQLLLLPRLVKRLIAVLLDISLCVLSVWLAYYLRIGEFILMSGNALIAIGVSIVFAIPIFIVFGLYRAIFRYSGWPALLAVTRATAIYGLLYASIFTAIGIKDVPRTIGIIQPILLLLMVGASRVFIRFWLDDQYGSVSKRSTRSKVLVYGAGISGRQLVAAMAGSNDMVVVGFLDDDRSLQGNVINQLPIYDPADLDVLVKTLSINSILLAMPNISRKQRNEILSTIQFAHVSVRTLPSVSDLAQGKVNISDVRELDIDDLLGRDSAVPDDALLAKNIRGKVVMVTGAGGSIGGELCRQILLIGPTQLLLIEQSEFALYNIHSELQSKLVDPKPVLIPLLASVQDSDRMNEIMATWHPSIVYHAAAYKHVPLVEHNPSAGIKNNVLGTLTTAFAAIENGVFDFVLVSTDKAVRPTNVMGASKRLAEMILQALSANTNQTVPKFSIVRFGNVLDSSGSVVPKFRQQIRDGSRVTLTHPEITRYFMTIPEAAQLVIQASAMATGGDVFVLDMGQPIKIMDLARRMIELSGFTVRDEQNPDGDIEIQIIGLRPGEKLYEELLIGNEPKSTSHPRIMRATEEFIPWHELEPKLKSLQQALNENNVKTIHSIMLQLVTGYTSNTKLVDWVYLERESPSSPQTLNN
jgi:FlaA1/EpsC-like NDP-sugar epimerase